MDPGLAVTDLALAQRMAYGVLVTEPDPAAAEASVARALTLVDEALAWPVEEQCGETGPVDRG